MRLLLALLLLVAAPQARGEEPALLPSIPSIRLSALRDLPDQELVRRVFGLLALFPYVSSRDSLDFSLPRSRAALWFWSRARAGGRAGVCRTDRLIVSFERDPLSPGDRKDPAMRPAGFDMQSYYIVENRKEAFGPYSPGERDRLQLGAACAKLDPRRDGIPADNASQLLNALKLVEALGAGAREGRALAPLDCSRFSGNDEPPADEAACLRQLSILRESSVGWVRQCPPLRKAPGGCIQVLVDRAFIEFDLDAGGTPIQIIIEGIEDLGAII